LVICIGVRTSHEAMPNNPDVQNLFRHMPNRKAMMLAPP
jgi:hypothetical protein